MLYCQAQQKLGLALFSSYFWMKDNWNFLNWKATIIVKNGEDWTIDPTNYDIRISPRTSPEKIYACVQALGSAPTPLVPTVAPREVKVHIYNVTCLAENFC